MPRYDLATTFTKSLYLPALDRYKRVPVGWALAEALRNERLTSEDLRSLALRKFRSIVGHALTESPYYARSLGTTGVRPHDIQSFADVLRLPLLSKDDVFAHREDLRARRFVGTSIRCTTSGSTGIAMSFFIDGSHAAWVEASVYRGRSWWGLARGDREFVLWARSVDDSPTKDLRASLKYRLRNRHQYDTFVDFTEQRADEMVAKIRTLRPRVLYGYGSSVGRLATYMLAKGCALEEHEAPVIVEYTADHMGAAERDAAAETFRAPVLSAYGSSEVGGVAQMCTRRALHMSIDHALVEFVRPDGTHAAPGETADIVLTTLNNHAMPLIRFQVGDVGSYSADPCPCGSPLPVMNLEIGKAIELIQTSATSGVSAHVLDYINLHLMKIGCRGIKQFFVEQTGLDMFRLDVVRDEVYEPRSTEIFVAKMREKLGDSITVHVRFVESIARRPSGKRMYFRRSFA